MFIILSLLLLLKNWETLIFDILITNLKIFSDEVYQYFKNKFPKIFYLKLIKL
jgi:hypothetical protein